jgi:NitT/TauT family transport system substrate-binding protein
MAGQPKPAFYVVTAAVVAGLIGLAIYNWSMLAPKAPTKGEETIDPKELQGQTAEQTDSSSLLTKKEYTFVPIQRLPAVTGISAYKKMTDNTVRFAINVWAGWAPIIIANEGFQASKIWKTSDGKDFKVEIELIDDPVKMRDAYASGTVQIGWATLDMVPLFLETFVDKTGKPRDTRIMPRIYQQIDWSNGGDGIVVRQNIQTVADLRGTKSVLAQNSPSHYFALNMLVFGGVQPSEVEWVPTEDAFQAAAAFNAKKDIAACVSWSPDIYNLSEKVRGNRMLVTTSQANKLIADVWFARADFAKDNPDIIEGLVRGIFDGMTQLKDEAGKKRVAPLMAKGYNIQESEALSMLGDAHSTNWAENYQFFLNQNNATNFEHVWNRSYYLYRRIGTITHQPVPFDQIMDFSVIQKLGKEEKYASQKDEYHVPFVAKTPTEIKGAEKEILTNTVYIRFFPNSWDLHKKINRESDGKTVEELYDPTVDLVLEEIAKLAGQFGAAHIIVQGHTDSSMKGSVPENLVKELSMNRANAVKEALLDKHKELDANRFAVEGIGWDRPADPNDPDNHAKNRRVEVKVYSAEKQ